MSELKIVDLSFCETDISSNSQVQGGLTLSLASITSLSASSNSIDSKTGNPTVYYSTTNGNKYFVTTDSTGKLVGVGGAEANSTSSIDGTTITTHASNFSVSGNLVDIFVKK